MNAKCGDHFCINLIIIVHKSIRQRDKSGINSSQMRFLLSLSDVTLRDRIKSEEIRKKWNVEEMIEDI